MFHCQTISMFFILFSHNRIRKYVEHESTKRALLCIFIWKLMFKDLSSPLGISQRKEMNLVSRTKVHPSSIFHISSPLHPSSFIHLSYFLPYPSFILHPSSIFHISSPLYPSSFIHLSYIFPPSSFIQLSYSSPHPLPTIHVFIDFFILLSFLFHPAFCLYLHIILTLTPSF